MLDYYRDKELLLNKIMTNNEIRIYAITDFMQLIIINDNGHGSIIKNSPVQTIKQASQFASYLFGFLNTAKTNIKFNPRVEQKCSGFSQNETMWSAKSTPLDNGFVLVISRIEKSNICKFIQQELKRVVGFGHWYEDKNRRDPDTFPLDRPNTGSGTWADLLSQYRQETDIPKKFGKNIE